jgi:hypothetical protein
MIDNANSKLINVAENVAFLKGKEEARRELTNLCLDS